MRRLATAATLMTLGLLAAPTPAAAEGCAAGEAQDACVQLSECFLVGAVVLLQADAIDYYRQCVYLDRRYKLEEHGSGDHAHRRARWLPRSQSEFLTLFCVAQENAGNTNHPWCRVRNTRSGGSTGGGGSGGDTGGRREPRFTG